MNRALMVIPVFGNVGLTTVALGLVKNFQQLGQKVSYFQPIIQQYEIELQQSIRIVHHQLNLKPASSMPIESVEHLLAQGKLGELLLFEEIIARYKASTESSDITVVKGLAIVPDQPYAPYLNLLIAEALSAKVILVAASDCTPFKTLVDQVSISANTFGDMPNNYVMGCIMNKLGATDVDHIKACVEIRDCFQRIKTPLLSCVPEVLSEKNEEIITRFVAKYIDQSWLKDFFALPFETRLTAPFFYYHLIKNACLARKKIALSDVADVRVLKAVTVCANRGIAHCVLVGEQKLIYEVAENNNITLHKDIEIIEPNNVLENYVSSMVALRKHKGLTPELAREMLKNPNVLSIMMLAVGDVDGVIAGSQQTTADAIRPALQLLKMPKGKTFISSVFFMCLPDKVLVFGDCAVNPNPSAEELAIIAIQSADSAKSVGIIPRVALLSYSSGGSAKGDSVEKVRKAVEIVRKERPDILMDGPMQYDAAINTRIANLKMPNSPVAGHANVFVFPNLDTANTVYKAVQQGMNILSIGPVLQGICKPMSDLSRGCTSEDIVFTIALVATQANLMR